MSELWSKAQIDSMTQAQQVMLRVGGYKTLRLSNLSGYTCTIASQKGYSTSNYDQGMLAQIPPWTVMPLDVTNWPSQVFVTLDPALFPLPTANTDLTDQEVVSADLSVLYLANMSPNTLLSRTTTDITTGTIDANITNAVVSVQTPAGESLPVTLPAGTQVEITNATIDVTPSGGTMPVEFGSAQEVIIQSGNTDSTITNEILPGNDAIFLLSKTVNISNLANGATQVLVNNNTGLTGAFDTFQVVVSSEGAYAYSLEYFAWFYAATYGYLNPPNYNVAESLTGMDCSGWIVTLPVPTVGSSLNVTVINNTGSTIVSDTVVVTVYGIRAQTQVNNDTSSPVNNAPIPGEPFNSYEIQLTQGTSVTWTELLPSGGKIQALHISIFQQSAAINSQVVITNGSNGPIIAQLPAYRPASSGSGPAFYSLYFGNGIANNGIYGYLQGGATGNTVMVTTFGVV